jgi:hypothetical protein
MHQTEVSLEDIFVFNHPVRKRKGYCNLEFGWEAINSVQGLIQTEIQISYGERSRNIYKRKQKYYLWSSLSFFWIIASKLVAPIGRLIPKVCAYPIKEGKSISNPMGRCCLSSLIEVRFDSIN